MDTKNIHTDTHRHIGPNMRTDTNAQTQTYRIRAHTSPGYNVSNRGASGHTMLVNGLCANGPGGSWRRPCLFRNDYPADPCSGNCSYWGSSQFQATIESNPDIITIMLGTNDAKWCNWYGPVNGLPTGAGTQFAADYTRMIRLFKALPSKPKVFVVLPPPGISQCSLTGPAGNASVCLAYNMSFHAINEVILTLEIRSVQCLKCSHNQ